MTNKQQLDPALLDSLVASHRNPWYHRGCAVGRLILDLEPGEYRDRLVGYMGESIRDVSNAAIIRAVEETLRVTLRSDSLSRHRRRSCTCPDEVYR